MKANELRLNNLVIVNHKTDLISIVTWIQEDSVNVKFERQPDLTCGMTVNPERIIPIPLTEEWLIRFGIIRKNITDDSPEDIKPEIDENDNTWYMWVKGAFNLELKDNGEVWFEVYSHYIHVKYVHQLQNLYWCLCEEELKLQ